MPIQMTRPRTRQVLCAVGDCGPAPHKPFRNVAESTHWVWVFETPHDPRPQAGVRVSILAIWCVPGCGQAQYQGGLGARRPTADGPGGLSGVLPTSRCTL
eukprot:3241299-Amphidinium_carterae.1